MYSMKGQPSHMVIQNGLKLDGLPSTGQAQSVLQDLTVS